MNKPGTMLIKNLRYLCLVGVIALGLMTIVGSNGGGGGATTADTTAPEDVTSLSAQPGDSKVTLSWTASANSEGDLAGHKVYYSSDGGTTYTTAESALSASATSYEVTGLTNGTCYTFKVTCYDEVPNESSGATVSCEIYDVTLNDPDPTGFPDVALPITVTGSNGHVSGLTSDNFCVVNAGTIMSPVTVTETGSFYTLTYTDITSGARDVYVYVNVPPEGDSPRKGGLSNTKAYGTNYALLVGLNEYPAAAMNSSEFSWVGAADPADDYVLMTPYYTPDGADDFELVFYDIEGGTNRPEVRIPPTLMTHLGGYTYRLDFDKPANYNDYDRLTVMYRKQNWLSNCINDITDLEAALKAKATSMNNSSWEDGNIYRLEDENATESTITNKISEIANGMENYDLFLFHFSGHGSQEGTTDEKQYLCAYEDDNWISVTDLSNALKNIPDPGNNYITNIFVFLDACHSGNFIGKGMEGGFIAGLDRTRVRKFRPFIPQREEEPSIYGPLKFSRDLQDMTNKNHVFVMTAVTGDKSAWDDSTLGNGVFTYYLVEGIDVTGKYISEAPANTNNDTWITAEEAFTYLDSKAEEWVSTAHGYPPDAVQDAQVQDNSTTTSSRLIYNW